MSITKAAIGAYYWFKDFDEVDGIYNIEGLETNVVEAANHVSKYTAEAKKINGKLYGWDYNHFRTAVESDKNLLAYCVEQLKPCGTKKRNEDGTYPWEYNDLMYQILACLEPIDIVKHFAGMVRTRNISDLYAEKENGEIFYYRKGETFWNNKRIDGGMKYGWKWEHTKSGIPLGPHGLYMTKDTAEQFGIKCKSYITRYEAAKVPIPRDMWWGIGKDEFTHYSYGWFYTEKCAYAVGYVCQVIAIVPNGVVSQLYNEEWGEENPKFMDHEKNKWKHPRWSFIKNIEDFQNNFEEKTKTYLKKLKEPPSKQRGASIIMPGGSGKSYYIDTQQIKDEFIDCDPLTWFANAQPNKSNTCKWNWDNHLKIICLQVDQVVALAKERGFWIMGATWWSGSQIDAIVILDEKVHRDRLSKKSDPYAKEYYDNTVKKLLIPQLRKDKKDYGFKEFSTIEACVNYIRANYSTATPSYNINSNNRIKF